MERKVDVICQQVCLIKLVISTLPLFYISFYKAPKAICDDITKSQKKLLRDWGKEGEKISWIGEKSCLSKEEGGLGIEDIKKFNKTL